MPPSVSEGQKLPLACPRCQMNAGVPLPTRAQAASGSGSGMVEMRCLSCGHVFDAVSATDKKRNDGETTGEMPIFRRKRDRRRA